MERGGQMGWVKIPHVCANPFKPNPEFMNGPLLSMKY